MADSKKPQILIELQLQMKAFKNQMKSVESVFKALKKSLEGFASTTKAAKQQADAIKEIGSATKKTTDAVTKGEKKKEKALKDTNKALDDQKKKMSALSSFGAGMMGGMGLGGLRKPTMSGIGGTIGRGIGGLASGLAGFATGAMASSYQTHMQVGQAQGGLIGLGKRSQLNQGTRDGRGLGFGPTETAYQAAAIGRATGNIGAVGKAQQFGRMTGMGVDEAGGYMGMIRQAGYGFGGQTRQGKVGKEGNREMSKLIEAGMISGLEKGRLPEFMQGVSQIGQQVGSKVTGKVNLSEIAAFQAMLGKSGKAGFQGSRGVAVTQQLGQAVMTPGGGEAGQSMMLQAMGFGKPGGETSYYDALKMQQQGLQGGGKNVQKMFTEVYSQMGQVGAGGSSPVNQDANIALSEMTGLSLQQVEDLGNIMNSGKNQEDTLKEMNAELEKAEDPRKAALAEMKGLGATVKHMAAVEAKQAKEGARYAKSFQKLQNLQLKAFEAMGPTLEKVLMWVVDVLRDIFNLVKDAVSYWVDRFGGSKKQKAKYTEIRKESLKGMKSYTPSEYKRLSIDQKIAYQQQKKMKLSTAMNKVEKEKSDYLLKKGGIGGMFDIDNILFDKFGKTVEAGEKATSDLGSRWDETDNVHKMLVQRQNQQKAALAAKEAVEEAKYQKRMKQAAMNRRRDAQTNLQERGLANPNADNHIVPKKTPTGSPRSVSDREPIARPGNNP